MAATVRSVCFTFKLGRSRLRDATFDGPSGILFNLDWSNPNRSKLNPQNVNIYHPTLYSFSTGNDTIEISKNYSPQLNLQAAFSAARNYSVAGHFGTFEFGAKIRNAHKFQDADDRLWNANDSSALMSNFLGSFTNPDYYDKSYAFGRYGRLRQDKNVFRWQPRLLYPRRTLDPAKQCAE